MRLQSVSQRLPHFESIYGTYTTLVFGFPPVSYISAKSGSKQISILYHFNFNILTEMV
ncbi:hypothetical protein DPMN_124655 [Dreissena polymorpha]|uniref:Uncharacterized protein n=1 Tax=Dreissena polymorpha TaxID=45954 RepID=A0A9D4GTT4_DREPO|nr:hypothetical protein DPMN_124655 [Dreissena polymorpha]